MLLTAIFSLFKEVEEEQTFLKLPLANAKPNMIFKSSGVQSVCSTQEENCGVTMKS
jgi:hypothetical protein